MRLIYTPAYSGLTGQQRPDVVLVFQKQGHPDLFVVFDAKYRLQSDTEYVATFGSPGPPIDAVNALHRYRDAIITTTADRPGRPTVKGVALFPLTAGATAQFVGSRLHTALGRVGIGSLPFTPGNTALVEQWIEELVGMGDQDLSWSGPPHWTWPGS